MEGIIKFVGLLLIFSERFTIGEDVSAVDQVITATNGTITSPSYPGPYGSNMRFTWRFEAPVGKVVELKFDELDLETDITDSRCIDTIEVTDGSARPSLLSLGPICNQDLGWPRYPTQFLSSFNLLTVVMQTNNRLSGRGFRASYRHVEPQNEYIAAIGVNYGETDGNGTTPSVGFATILRFHRFQARFLPPIVVPESTQPSALTFDPITDFFYYTDIGGKFIGRIHVDGEQSDILIRDGIENPLGIAAAYLKGLLYWTDAGRDEVSVSRLDGLDRKTLVGKNSGCVYPRGVALSPDHEYVFWSCRGRIERSKADGSKRKVFLDGVDEVTSLFIHPEGQKLFWMGTTGPVGFVEEINLDSSGRNRVFVGQDITEFHDFVVDKNLFFWSHPETGRLYHKTQNGSPDFLSHSSHLIKITGLFYVKPTDTRTVVYPTIKDAYGTFSSPSYLGHYPPNVTYIWKFQAPVGKVLEVTFDELDLKIDATDNQCIDKIEVIDGSVGSGLLSLSPICTKQLGWPRFPTQIVSSFFLMTVRMQTDVGSSGRGFRANYRQVEPQNEYIAAIGVNYGRADGNGITPDDGVATILRFHRFQARFLPPIVVPESTQPSALTYDPISDFFYYTDIGGKFIGRIHVDGEQSDIVIRDDIENPLGIAAASLMGLLFWTDEGRNEVSVSRLNGLDRKTIVTADSGCVSPRGIALTPDNEYVFWSCSGRIERSKTDGSGREVFLDEINGVRSLFIHPQDQKLYWMNTAGPIGIVERINLDGSNRSPLFQEEQISEFHDFVVDKSLFFWSDQKTGILYHKTQNSSFGVLYHPTESIKIKGLYYVSSDAAKIDGCVNFNNGSCTKVCFPGGHNITCRQGYTNTSVSIRFPVHYVILGAAILVVIVLVVVFVGRAKFQSQPEPTRANKPI